MGQFKYRKFVSPILVLLIWQGISAYGIVPNWFLPIPTEVLKTLVGMMMSGEVPHHTLISLGRAVSGYLLAAVVGIALGLLIAWSTLIEDFFDPLIELIRPLSTFALIPIFFLWFGIGNTSKILIIFKSCFFPIVINTIAGIKGVDSKLIMAAQSLGANGFQLWTRVLLPSALPMIITGLRISTAIAMMALVGVEMLSSDSGLGFLVIDAQRTFDTERVFAGIGILSILGFSLDKLARYIQSKVLAWHSETSLGGGM
ncbi:ABC transporter permease [Desulfofustis glycolicus]|uniref:NitT/TauT family transport system permease protein n=1 Tax=Desulfofustis glycolicus DSM 9705 TaxID=1121409 RepID=A0A1M5YV92_9BACT|nr:ABC transporter permease [Desulfofustis glycolicus]MCB2218561.1 ABC transporter permease [Desulfobulbaceae bacterium]SHI15463.1 NitT/TauT family transport system permease protein [Desulfofustis glycolicus DSM 9705]